MSSLHREHANLLCIVKRLFNARAETRATVGEMLRYIKKYEFAIFGYLPLKFAIFRYLPLSLIDSFLLSFRPCRRLSHCSHLAIFRCPFFHVEALHSRSETTITAHGSSVPPERSQNHLPSLLMNVLHHSQ